MPGIARRGIYAKHHLNEREMAEVQNLATLCNTYEHLLMRLDYNLLALPRLPTNDMFLTYNGDQLIGCLLLDRYHTDVKEVTGMVHPTFRRQGIFTRLLQAASQECVSRGVQRLLFICETTSASGEAFIRSLDTTVRDSSEHRMILQKYQPREQANPALQFREALSTDIPALALVLGQEIAERQEARLAHIQRLWQQPERQFYLASLASAANGQSEPVGTLRVEEMPDEIAIYGFVVRPQYRQQGYGRQILEGAIAAIRTRSQKPIVLDVDTNNFTALNLYQSIGFVIDRTYTYYAYSLVKPS